MIEIRYYSAPWCGPCKQLSPIVEKVANAVNSQLVKVDISTDEGAELASANGVRGVPTIAVYRDGQLIDVRQGMMSEAGLLTMVDGAIL